MDELLEQKNTFSDWGELWYSNIEVGVSKSQCISLRCYLNHLYRFIGDIPICNIKAQNIDEIIKKLAMNNPNTNRPMSKKTLRDIRNTASRVFDTAIENDVQCANPAHNRKIPRRAPEMTRRALTVTEQKLIIMTHHRARLGSLVMMLAGPRRGELIPLTWDDVDLDNLKLVINKSVEQIGSNTFHVKRGTKTEKDGRVVDIPLDLAIEIEGAKKVAKSEFICCKLDGTMHTPTSFKKMWEDYIKTIIKLNPQAALTGIKNITPHYLRHTYATLLYMSGVDVLTAAKLLGHTDVRTTIAIYTHLEKTMTEKSIDRFDTYVSEKLF